VDDDHLLAAALARALAAENYAIEVVHGLETALVQLSTNTFAAIVTDLDLGPGAADRGCPILEACQLHQPHALRVLMSGRTVDVASRARHLAHGFLEKPFPLSALAEVLSTAPPPPAVARESIG
jgi:DNA-binding NtrC family response regulator